MTQLSKIRYEKFVSQVPLSAKNTCPTWLLYQLNDNKFTLFGCSGENDAVLLAANVSDMNNVDIDYKFLAQKLQAVQR